jgi:hypothetical protein
VREPNADSGQRAAGGGEHETWMTFASWGLATLAYGIRSLCWGDPDLAARDSCEAQWVAAAFVLALVGCLSLIAGFWPSGRAGSGPS